MKQSAIKQQLQREFRVIRRGTSSQRIVWWKEHSLPAGKRTSRKWPGGSLEAGGFIKLAWFFAVGTCVGPWREYGDGPEASHAKLIELSGTSAAAYPQVPGGKSHWTLFWVNKYRLALSNKHTCLHCGACFEKTVYYFCLLELPFKQASKYFGGPA